MSALRLGLLDEKVKSLALGSFPAPAGSASVLRAVIPHMLEQGGGSIISTASVYGLAGGITNGPYCTAKAGLIDLSRTAAVEYARRNIRVDARRPSAVEATRFHDVLGYGFKTREAIEEMHPMGRTTRPEEVANLALFLASDESSAITGQAIVIDGGLLANCDIMGVPPVA